MSGELNLQPFRIPLVDPNTGLISREWSKYINQLQARVGGTILDGNTANLVALIGASVAAAVADLSQQPPVIPPEPIPGDVGPFQAPCVPERIDPDGRLEALEAEVAQLRQDIEGLRMAPQI